ncbi:Sec14p-like phosphatidylinositol transfer family protein [Arachis hypogaea]|nr:Sec14p-like phosphatidylinositol transfer family protein [Arachis hypogaea]
MDGHNRTTCRVRHGISQLEGHGNDTFINDSDDHMNIEDDSLALYEALMSLEELLAYINSQEEARLRKKKFYW